MHAHSSPPRPGSTSQKFCQRCMTASVSSVAEGPQRVLQTPCQVDRARATGTCIFRDSNPAAAPNFATANPKKSPGHQLFRAIQHGC